MVSFESDIFYYLCLGDLSQNNNNNNNNKRRAKKKDFIIISFKCEHLIQSKATLNQY